MYDDDRLYRACSQRLNKDLQSLKAGVEFYNSDFSQYGNEIYGRIESRLAHWINYQNQDWFTERLAWPLQNALDFDIVLDVGFSVPYVYDDPVNCAKETPRWVFVDKEQSAAEFYEILVDLLGCSRVAARDSVLVADIEVESTHCLIMEEIKQNYPSSLLVVASEVLEHLRVPERFWELVYKLKETSASVDVYVTLPIGDRIPSHEMEFRSVDQASNYLKHHMTVSKEFAIKPPLLAAATPYLKACYCAAGTIE